MEVNFPCDDDYVQSHPSVHHLSEQSCTDLFCGWTPEQLADAQKADTDLAPLISWMEEGNSRPPWADLAPHSPATKAYWSQWKRLYKNDGVLMQKYYCAEGRELG